MKKTLSIIALSIIGFGLVSCKKEEKKEVQGAGTETIELDTAGLKRNVAPLGTVSDSAKQTKASVSNQPLTTIALSQSNYDFGNIKKGDKVNHVYEITNTGKNPLIISEVKPGCGCTAPEFTKEPILPGQKGKITLSFDSTSFDGAVQKYADVFANVEKSPIKLTFNANIQP
ncbi:DUF1573 domain-containing protein [Chryseobacterium sp. C-71]|uniref:DUF1573 domain-containing protein n=1 Tax=Chryseobacterium sp. C-71 TaxID=2893882 RepID=UPI001E33EC25|nr:DUF1573 domain-containing protein [Chryseobacterium sp. C-71]UFH33763.1 DUF1573 domain-containing protein [Chryseobacterium sp. C-71]